MLDIAERQLPPRPGKGQVSVNCSAWEIFEERDAFGREWVIRGLNDPDDVVTIEVAVSVDRLVTIVVDPGIPAGTADVKARLIVDGEPEAPFVRLQHRPISGGASILAPVDQQGLHALLDALGKGAGMSLLLVGGEDEILQAPLYNDPSYREVLGRMAS